MDAYDPDPCRHGHVFVWTSSYADGVMPDGLRCKCGRQMVQARNGYMTIVDAPDQYGRVPEQVQGASGEA